MMPEANGSSRRNGFGELLRALLGPALIFAVALYAYVLAGYIDEAPPDQLGAAFWPKLTLILLMVSCGIKALEIIRDRHKLEEAAENRPEVDNLRLGLMILLLVLTVAAIDVMGFALANLLFMLIFLYLAGLRRKVTLVLVSVLGTIGVLYIFAKVVYLPLPKGWGVFEDISLLIYRGLFIL